jgi:hypothetical protein
MIRRMIRRIVSRIFNGMRKNSKDSGLPKEETEGKLCEDGTAALDDAMAAPSKEEKPDSAPPLPVLYETHFNLEGGRYRIGNHWLHEGITCGDIATLCYIVNTTWSVDQKGTQAFWGITATGDLIAETGTRYRLIINKNVKPDDARLAFENFMTQVDKERQAKS